MMRSKTLSCVFFTSAYLAILAPIGSESPRARDLTVILTEISMLQHAPDENKTHIRLNAALERLNALVKHSAANRIKTNADFATLWTKMNSVEGKSVAYPELLFRILQMPFAELIKNTIAIGLIAEVEPGIRGCCAIDSYYKFNHEKIIMMPDAIVLALRSRLHHVRENPAKGLHHGIMIELVDRGYYGSYNGYACTHNTVTGCRITAE
jgi:hypothetical protein